VILSTYGKIPKLTKTNNNFQIKMYDTKSGGRHDAMLSTIYYGAFTSVDQLKLKAISSLMSIWF